MTYAAAYLLITCDSGELHAGERPETISGLARQRSSSPACRRAERRILDLDALNHAAVETDSFASLI